MSYQTAEAAVSQWGNGLAVRLTKVVAKTAGMTDGTQVRITAEKGRIVLEAVEPGITLASMLASFDPVRHGGEVMTFAAVGEEFA
ncbi:AbrB/MazE/SpoVT family DNA-binding domain-containing protein [Massilia antarctica]|uniref:AbrB/MazE/SpoVT family DNA-binding domain-containing protein n=1 Tax=Massilia antarctica TaxID=2765360 RepID=UPI0035F05856